MHPRDIYIQLTDPARKHGSVINYHRVWDAQRFIDAMRKQYEQAGKPEDVRLVSVISKPN